MTDIVVVTPGNYTPGAESTLNAAASIINAAWNLGNEKNTSFETKINSITSGWLNTVNTPTITSPTVDAPTVVEPTVSIPAVASTGDVMSLFDSKYLELVQLLADKFTVFRTTYFPDEGDNYAALEAWLGEAINNPTTGLPTAVANQIIEDDKTRILAGASRATDEVMVQFAARRFPLPPGAAAAAVIEIQQKAQDEIAESSRKVVVGSIEQMRFVIEKTQGLRQIAMDSAIKYITALASGPDMASKLVNIGYDAQSKLISAASQFYNSRTAVAELQAKVGEFNAANEMEASAKNQMAQLTMIEDKLKALLAEAQAIAQMATSLFNNVHASAGTNYSVSA